MGKTIFLIIFTMFASINSCAQQNKMKIEDIKEILVYDSYNLKGYTRGEVYRKFQELESNKITKIRLNSVFIASLKSMLISSAKQRKTLPSKCGQNIVFVKFILNDGSSRNIIVNSTGIQDYFVGKQQYYFIDSSDKKDATLWKNNFYNKFIDVVNHNI